MLEFGLIEAWKKDTAGGIVGKRKEERIVGDTT